MSILLDALKRSESQRELGTVPTLQTSIDSSADAARQVPGWMPALMSLAAAGLIGWMVVVQFRVSEHQVETKLTTVAGTTSANQAASQTDETATVRSDAASKSILPQLPDSAATDAQEEERRLGREVRDYTSQEPAASSPLQAAEAVADPKRENALRDPELASVELVREQPGLAAAAPTDRANTVQTQQPYEPEIINYWQVPEKMRDGLPDLRISVLVYAELPENRFVLMNGERLREGQELPNGLLLEEIRRDRAIFNYKNYRFYLKS
jgi:general secretion pathway protein B